MRSLPPPRITRKRRWRRLKRAVRYFFRKGRFSDPGNYQYRNKSQSISKIKQSRISSRLKRTRWTKSESVLNQSHKAVKTASFMGRVARRMSMPVFRTNKVNVSMKFR